MKKFIAASLACAMSAASIPAYAQDSINVTVNGKQISFQDQAPVIKDNTVLVPLRKISEEMGSEISWNHEENCAYVKRGLEYISFTVGETDTYIGQDKVTFDAAPELINNRIMISVNSIADAFDASVEWDMTSNTVSITNSRTVTSVNKSEISAEVKADDGSMLYTVNYEYPVLNESITAPGKAAANETIKSFFENICTGAEAEIKTAAAEINAYVNEDGERHIEPSIFGGYEVTYVSDNIISLYTDISIELGGAHPMTYRHGLTVDLNTGEQLALADIVEEDTTKLIKDTYSAAISNDKEQRFFPGTAERLDEIVPNVDFYIEKGSIVLFAQLYEVAPYAAWFVTIPVSVDNFKITI
ncbi:protease inhibitor [Clostridiales bacterium]|nr:protease inhibitor [Clostridiales bacterium]